MPEARLAPVTESTTLALALLVLGWAILSGALARHNVTGPLVFAVAGYLLANPDWGPLGIHVDAPSVHVVAEVTLALVLFSDASRVNVIALRRDAWLPVRLLAIGLPLSVALRASSVRAGSDRRRPERTGDRRRADTVAAPAGSERRERAQ
jgi:NhaP-type Na+/H+ or K+/H+ antiporter